MSGNLVAKSSIEDADFWLSSSKAKVNDPSTLRKMYLDTSDECILCRGGAEDCNHIFFQCPFARTIWATQGVMPVEAIY